MITKTTKNQFCKYCFKFVEEDHTKEQGSHCRAKHLYDTAQFYFDDVQMLPMTADNFEYLFSIVYKNKKPYETSGSSHEKVFFAVGKRTMGKYKGQECLIFGHYNVINYINLKDPLDVRFV